MNTKIKRKVIIILILPLLLNCTGKNLKISEQKYKSVRFDISPEMSIAKEKFESLNIKYQADQSSAREVVVKPYSFTRGRERISLTGDSGFKTELYSGEVKAVMLILKNGKLEETLFIEAKGRGEAHLLRNLEREINELLKN